MKPEAIFDWIKYTLADYIDDQHIIRERQNGETPSSDYVTFGLLSCVPDDYPTISKEAKDSEHGIRTVTGRYKIVVSVTAFSNDGYAYLDRLKKSPKLDSVRPVFRDNDIALIDCSGFKDLTFLGDTTYKPKYQSDFTFTTFIGTEEEFDLIKAYYLGYYVDDSYRNDYINVGDGISIRENDQYIGVDKFA